MMKNKDVAEEIQIYTCFSSYEFDSFIRGYHVYQHIWALVVRETYNCTREPGNEQDCNAVTVIYKDKVVVHIPLAISKCIFLFLTLPGSFLETIVTGRRINRGGGYALEVPCKYGISRESCTLDKEKSDHISTNINKKNFSCVRFMDDD